MAGATPEQIEDGLSNCEGVPGRFEMIDEGQPFSVIVVRRTSRDGTLARLKPRALTLLVLFRVIIRAEGAPLARQNRVSK